MGLQTYRGLTGVRDAFIDLFAQMIDLSDLGAPVVNVYEDLGHVFLVWKNPASGFRYGTDSFMTNKHGKFVRQHVVISKAASGTPAAIVPDPSDAPTHAAWRHHHAAFGNQSVKDIVLDYAEDATINIYNQADGSLVNYTGHAGVVECFTELFANLRDTSDCTEPI